ncbi:multicopper oxidase domain-containing protein [Thermus oshimai]|uniref:multicopper oxidase domain-containing protein n=1 Tax=Thermus oshimai TaxID=56957 RepID=UPI0039A4DCE6
MWKRIAALLVLSLSLPALAAVKRFELTTHSSVFPVDQGVYVKGFSFNEMSPGPLLVVEEGDTVEIVLRNEDFVTHGLSIHAANTQTSKFLGNVQPGEERVFRFQADFPGVFMYHCAPGGHGIMAHTMGGQHGMIVVEPKKKYRLEAQLGRAPDLKLYLVQSEWYASGRDFFDGRATYVVFNGQNFRYVKEPIPVRPGDYIRIYFLNAGPNLTSTFHVVGGVWEYMYYQGNPDNVVKGSQTALAGPSDSWVIEWRVPPVEGDYTLVTHVFGTAIKGALGILRAKKDAPRVAEVRAEGPKALKEVPQEAKRVLDPYGLGTPTHEHTVRKAPDPALLQPVAVGERTLDPLPVTIQMVGNSFYPKVVEVPVGTTVEFVNEDVFDLLEGERTGRHDAVVVDVKGPEPFVSPKLGHGERWRVTFTQPGEYTYICSIHPYMRGIIRVYAPTPQEAHKGH